MLIKSVPLLDEELREEIWRKFSGYGIAKERIELIGWTEGAQEHLQLYGHVDVHLDTFPYNGTTTTCEALWQGVPTVTLAGSHHHSRVGLSLMHQMGLDDWVAYTDQEYIDIAVSKVENLKGLNDLRKSMRNRMLNSSLMDGKGFVEELDQNFRIMIEQYNQKLLEGTGDKC